MALIIVHETIFSPPVTASNSEKGGKVYGDSRWVSSDGGIGGSGGGRRGWMESSMTSLRPSVLSHL
jgi:hypothetical protein